MPGQGRRFASHAFHQIAVTAEGKDAMAKQLEAGPIVSCRIPLRGDRHSDTRRHTLPQRTRGRLDPRRFTQFRMPGAGAVQLSEIAQIVERDRGFARDLSLVIHMPYTGQVEQ